MDSTKIDSIKCINHEEYSSEITSLLVLKDGSIVLSDDDGYVTVLNIDKKEGNLILKEISKTLIGDTGHLIAEVKNDDDEKSDLIITTFGDIEKYSINEKGLEKICDIGSLNKPTFYDLKVLTNDRIAVCSNMNNILIIYINTNLLFSEIVIDENEDEEENPKGFGLFHNPKETVTLFQIKDKEILVTGSADKILRFWNIEPKEDDEEHVCDLIAKIKKVPTCINTTICQIDNLLVVGGIGYINIISIIEKEKIIFQKTFTFDFDNIELDTFSVCSFDNNFSLCGGRKGELVKINIGKNNFSYEIKKGNISESTINFIVKVDDKHFVTGCKDGVLKLFEI